MTLQEFKRVFWSNPGFTIKKMTAVVAVISVIMAIAVPYYVSRQPSLREHHYHR
jgi:competence protein ComGC